jgi:hypothetical protein
MKTLFTVFAALVIAASLGMGVARAQGAASGPFADVPTDHWAYQSVDTLQKAGIVIGYPDGTYGGRRAMTRYEFAVAIARLLKLINPPVDLSPYAKTSDLDQLRSDLLAKLQQNTDALNALKALVDQFQTELQALGQDVTAIKAELAGIQQRLAVVEDEQRRVKITGEVNVIGRGNLSHKNDVRSVLDANGFPIGDKNLPSLLQTVNVYNDVLLNIQGRVSDNAQAVVKIDAGNYLPSLGSATALDPSRYYSNGEAATQFGIYNAYLDTSVSLGPLTGARAVVGRQGIQFTPYTLKAVDPDIYTYLPETDSGDVIIDAAKLAFNVGPGHLQVYAGKSPTFDSTDPWVAAAGPSTVAASGIHRPGSITPGGATFTGNPLDISAGARLTFGNPDNAVLGFTAVTARLNGPNYGSNLIPDPYSVQAGKTGTDAYYNNLQVYGADFHGLLPFALAKTGVTLDAEGAMSQTGFDGVVGNRNGTYHTGAVVGTLGYAFGPFSVKGGYQYVDPFFASPGYWGHVGTWTNPTNIKGPIASASYAVSPKLGINAAGAWYDGIYDNQNIPEVSPLGRHDHLTNYNVGLKYGLTSQYDADLGYEWVQYDLKAKTGFTGDTINAGKPTEQYITIGVGHSFNKNASLKLLYQILDYQDKKTNFDPAGNSSGGVAVTQFQLKF